MRAFVEKAKVSHGENKLWGKGEIEMTKFRKWLIRKLGGYVFEFNSPDTPKVSLYEIEKPILLHSKIFVSERQAILYRTAMEKLYKDVATRELKEQLFSMLEPKIEMRPDPTKGGAWLIATIEVSDKYAKKGESK